MESVDQEQARKARDAGGRDRQRKRRVREQIGVHYPPSPSCQSFSQCFMSQISELHALSLALKVVIACPKRETDE